MRITGGRAAGRRLKVPKGLGVRPTPDLVKQAIFNSLGPRVEAARVLELFGGSGALSMEALSRGAREALCIEKVPSHARLIIRNAESVGLRAPRFQVRIQDAFHCIEQLAASHQAFELILADPPYGEKNIGRRSNSFAQRLLDDPHLPGLVAPGGTLMLGHTKRDTLEFPPAWVEVKTLKHGDTMIRFLQPAGPG
jgi:16S rRNA (guanine(966)-N(2))-methyltransferase RsmD